MQKCSVASITFCQSDKYRLTVCVSIFRDPLLDSHSLSLVNDIASLNASSFCEQDDVFLASGGCNASRVPPLLLVLFDRRLDFIFGINIIIVINYLWACILPTCVDQTDQAAQAFFFLSLSIFFSWMADLSSLHAALQFACSQDQSQLKIGEKQLLSWESQAGYYSGLSVS